MAQQLRKPITLEVVERLFREAWPRRQRYPDSDACYSVVVKMNVVQLKGVKPPKRQRLLINVKAAKHARLFLKHLQPDRERIRDLDPRTIRHDAGGAFPPYPIETLPEVWRKIMEQIDKMQAVEQDVRALLDAPYPFPDRRNAARFIADAVEEAWRRAGETSPPRSEPPEPRLGEDDPLCVFVTQALAEIGHDYRPSYVSDMLRNRHHRPRSGKARRPRSGKAGSLS